MARCLYGESECTPSLGRPAGKDSAFRGSAGLVYGRDRLNLLRSFVLVPFVELSALRHGLVELVSVNHRTCVVQLRHCDLGCLQRSPACPRRLRYVFGYCRTAQPGKASAIQRSTGPADARVSTRIVCIVTWLLSEIIMWALCLTNFKVSSLSHTCFHATPVRAVHPGVSPQRQPVQVNLMRFALETSQKTARETGTHILNGPRV